AATGTALRRARSGASRATGGGTTVAATTGTPPLLDPGPGSRARSSGDGGGGPARPGPAAPCPAATAVARSLPAIPVERRGGGARPAEAGSRPCRAPARRGPRDLRERRN